VPARLSTLSLYVGTVLLRVRPKQARVPALHMLKRCPYCKEYTFGEKQLLTLDYYNEQPCTECGKLVRNDGFRHALWGPAIVVALFLGGLVAVNLPERLIPVGVLLTIALPLGVTLLMAKPVKAEPRQINEAAFVPDPRNDKVVLVEGWNQEQLMSIIEGFMNAGVSSYPHYEIAVHWPTNSSARLTFQPDIHPAELAALVNYLHYPIEFNVGGRDLNALGRMTLTGAFDGVPPELIGQRALLYVPENDKEHDLVSILVDSGSCYSYSFADGYWYETKDARMSPDALRLKRNLAWWDQDVWGGG
jgi:hypothetical protein